MEKFYDYLKTCPNCNADFEAARLNQTYCSSQCKIQFNNFKARKSKLSYSSIAEEKNKKLWKNREILKKYVDQTVKLKELEKLGFKLRYITEFYFDKIKNQDAFMIYDYGYIFIDKETIKIASIYGR